jgi:hypothetical protein
LVPILKALVKFFFGVQVLKNGRQHLTPVQHDDVINENSKIKLSGIQKIWHFISDFKREGFQRQSGSDEL